MNSMNRRRFLLYSLLASPLLVSADAYWLEPKWIKVRTVQIAARPTHRIVHVSDIHHKGDRAYLESAVRKINELSPDLVCFTGDLIEVAFHSPEALEILGGVKSPLYGVPGNHDYWAKVQFDSFGQTFAKTGGGWLMDAQVMSADGKVCITGATCTRRSAPKQHAPRPNCKNLMLMHYPKAVENLPPHKFDLILAGHSHGGQVRIPFYGSILTMMGVGKFEMGLFQTEAGPLYVNPGLGWFASPIRFNCRPEITVLDV